MISRVKIKEFVMMKYDIYDTSELEHEFEYGIYEDVLKTEQLMAELKRIDEAENENKKSRDVHFGDFPLEQFSDAGKVANEGDPHLKQQPIRNCMKLKSALYKLILKNMNLIIPVDALTILIRAKEPKTNITANELIMMMMMKRIYYKLKLVKCNYLKMEKNTMINHDENTLRKMVYGPTYVPYNEDGQKLLLPQTTDMSRKDNLKLLYNSLPEGMCDNEYESLEQAVK